MNASKMSCTLQDIDNALRNIVKIWREEFGEKISDKEEEVLAKAVYIIRQRLGQIMIDNGLDNY